MNSKLVLSAIAIVVAFALIASPLLAANDADARKKNSLRQSISQSQESNQNSLVVSGGSTTGSGNNVNIQLQGNTGGNTAGQNNN
ncbi:MAG: hypothetical protein M3162_01300 [Thermoproteota archaeon]|nr:hypothetical protein [Thermoproteota archaeon]